MFCPKCGNDIADDSAFCQYCGKTVSTAQTPHISQQKPKPATPKKEKKPVNILLVLAVTAIGFAIGKFVISPAIVNSYNKTEQPQNESQSDFTVTIPDAPEIDFPDTPATSDGSLHSKIIKLVGNSGTVKVLVTYCEGTYNGAPDDTVLGLDIETEYDRAYPVDSTATSLRRTANELSDLNNPNFSWRDNSNDYYYNIDFHFNHLDSSDSTEVIPYIAELIGLSSYGSTLKMSQVEDSLLRQGYSITYED